MADEILSASGSTTTAAPPPPDKPTAPAKDPYAPAEIPFEEAMDRFAAIHAGKPKPRKPVELGGIGRVAGDPVKPKESKEEKKESEKKPDEKEKAPDEKAGEGKPKEPEVAPAKPEKRKAREQKPIDEERIAEIVATATAKAAQQQPPPKPDKPQEEAIPSEYKDKYEVLKEMATRNAKNADLPKKLIEFAKQEDDYIKQWKRENPGEKWNAEDDIHSDFYNRATPVWDEGEFRKAEIGIAIKEQEKEIREKVLSELDPRLKKIDELEQTNKLRDLAPQIASVERQTMGAILETINADYAKKVEPDELKKLADEDPVAFEVAIELGREAIPFAAEVTRLWNSNGAIKADSNNPLHQHIFGYGQEIAKLIKQLPEDDQQRDGKHFATWTEYNQMSQAQQNKHWTLTGDDLIKRKILDAQELAKEKYKGIESKFESWATKRGLAKGSAQNISQNGGKEKEPTTTKPAPDKDKLPSPSTTGRTSITTDSAKNASTEDAYMDSFANVLAGRRV